MFLPSAVRSSPPKANAVSASFSVACASVSACVSVRVLKAEVAASMAVESL